MVCEVCVCMCVSECVCKSCEGYFPSTEELMGRIPPPTDQMLTYGLCVGGWREVGG